MPIGIDTEQFAPRSDIQRTERSVLFLGRIAPTKRPELLIEALGMLNKKGEAFTASVYGSPQPEHEAYYTSLQELARERGVGDVVRFHKGIPPHETPRVYAAHQICVNLSSSGMYDKTIFEAMASGTLVLVSNENLRGVIPDEFVYAEGDVDELSAKLGVLLNMPESVAREHREHLRAYVVEQHSLKLLGKQVVAVLGKC